MRWAFNLSRVLQYLDYLFFAQLLYVVAYQQSFLVLVFVFMIIHLAVNYIFFSLIAIKLVNQLQKIIRKTNQILQLQIMSLLNLAKIFLRYNFAIKRTKITKLLGQNRQLGGNQLYYDVGHTRDWFFSTSKSLTRTSHLRLKQFLINRNDNKCQCCGIQIDQLQIHQRWDYDFEKSVKKLMRFICLCKDCHSTTHMGFPWPSHYDSRQYAKRHIIRIRGWSEQEQRAHAEQAVNIKSKRGSVFWMYDLSLIKKNDLALTLKATLKQNNYQIRRKHQITHIQKPKITHISKPEFTEIIGQDRQFGGNLLCIDLVPITSWFRSISQSIVRPDWKRLIKFTHNRVDHKCQCCRSSKRLKLHERWSYDNNTKIQKLMRLVSLCHQCHQATHMKLAMISDKGQKAIKHIRKVRDWSQQQYLTHEYQAFKVWQERSKIQWKLDLSLIFLNNLTLKQQMRQMLEQQQSKDLNQRKNN